MKRTFTLLCISISLHALSQPDIQWKKTYGGSILVYSILAEDTTSDGGFILAGQLNGEDAKLVKLNALGGLEWKKSYGGSSIENFQSVQQTNDGGYIAVGQTYSNDG